MIMFLKYFCPMYILSTLQRYYRAFFLFAKFTIVQLMTLIPHHDTWSASANDKFAGVQDQIFNNFNPKHLVKTIIKFECCAEVYNFIIVLTKYLC